MKSWPDITGTWSETAHQMNCSYKCFLTFASRKQNQVSPKYLRTKLKRSVITITFNLEQVMTVEKTLSQYFACGFSEALTQLNFSFERETNFKESRI